MIKHGTAKKLITFQGGLLRFTKFYWVPPVIIHCFSMGFSINHPAIGVPPWLWKLPFLLTKPWAKELVSRLSKAHMIVRCLWRLFSKLGPQGFIESGQEIILWQSVPCQRNNTCSSSLNENRICKSTDKEGFCSQLTRVSFQKSVVQYFPRLEAKLQLPLCSFLRTARSWSPWPHAMVRAGGPRAKAWKLTTTQELKWTRFLRSTGGEVNLPGDVNVTTHKEPPIWGEIVWMGVWRREANATQDLVEAWLAVLTWKFTTASSKAFWCGDL